MKYVFGLLLVLFSVEAFAKDRFYQGRSSGAIRGYDVVAYYTQSDAVRGSKKITYKYGGAEWRFASEENRDLFKADPEKYVPQYGGYCAKAMSGDRFLKIDPKAWTIIDDKLYLNYSSRTRATWRTEQGDLIAQADGYWANHLVETFGETPKAVKPAEVIATEKVKTAEPKLQQAVN